MAAIRITLVAIALTMPFRMAADINPSTPIYTTASIVNAASYSAAALAPNTIASIYGANLAFSTQALTPATMTGGGLPIELNGVGVYIGGYSAGLYYVSPTQINLLIPNVLTPGVYPLAVIRDGFAGPPVSITLNLTGPALFADNFGNVVAQHLDGSLVTSAAPGNPGEWVVLYALGLGRTIPDAQIYVASESAAPIANINQFALQLNGVGLPPANIYYAGITPNFAGLYQINLLIPLNSPATPQIQISIGTAVSAGPTQLPVS